jgi:glycogen operon protein
MLLAGDEFLRTQRGNNNAWCQDNDISWVNWGLAEEHADFLRFTKELIGLRKRHPVLRRRRFFVGEVRRGAALPFVPNPEGVGPFPASGPVRHTETGQAAEERVHSADATGRPSDEPGPPPQPVTAPALADIHWHGVDPHRPDFGYYSRSLAFSLDGRFSSREQEPDDRPDADLYVAFNAWHEPLKFRIPAAPTRRKWRRVIDTALEGPHDFVAEGDGPVVAEGAVCVLAPYSTLVLVSEP